MPTPRLLRYHGSMPSWNIHTAHAETVLAAPWQPSMGINDANAFLFGNYVPDIYVGYMVPDTTYRMDYLLTHVAEMDVIPIPDADRFWDYYIAARTPKTETGLSMALGAWAHLVADRYYNGSFRGFCQAHDLHADDDLRQRKQADFDLFGRSLTISSHVLITPELIDAAQRFVAYRILPADVERAVRVASRIVENNAIILPRRNFYQVISADWLYGVFDACNARVIAWLRTWNARRHAGLGISAAAIRTDAGFPPSMPNDPHWQTRHAGA